ncbi:integrase core domain-containing protein [Rurimicrobium arvi]|uniref:integrase core domain-containing protein n=1 Tax=Rurimicrobium arvi TaxID=2049916 RepID=UPI003CD05AC8
MERFNRTYRQDVLDAYLFESIHEVRMITEDWINDYNNQRSHEALNGLTPKQFEESLSFELLV